MYKLTIICSAITSFIVFTCSYVFPGEGISSSSGQVISGSGSGFDGKGIRNSNIIIGRWVFEPSSRPIYNLTHTGDINGDGRVDIADALLSLQSAVGLIQLSDTEIMRGDVGPLVNDIPVGDGKVNIDDAILILRKAVGLNW